jgi:2-polyprenyl-6-hydroxyphenyl methylase/3-demethylubiquinone-9 3-methyltransferase
MLCRAWALEKRWYAAASPPAQARARGLYTALFRLAHTLRGSDFGSYVEGYRSNRGMSFAHDVHDWLGGYPYESVSPREVEGILSGFGFAEVRSFTRPLALGLFGSGCDEYVYVRSGAEPKACPAAAPEPRLQSMRVRGT